jgi:hypothetical protein
LLALVRRTSLLTGFAMTLFVVIRKTPLTEVRRKLRWLTKVIQTSAEQLQEEDGGC